MFDKILVANRGEIALRIMRACREMGIKTVAVYSEADANTLPVAYADEAVCIGPAPAARSYLVAGNILQAALNTGAQAIHPGYGFLAENAAFARLCAARGVTFIGPSPETIELLGDKSRTRGVMRMAVVPTIPGSEGCVKSVEEAARFANRVGYPVLIKATAGAEGKGLREVRESRDLEAQFLSARAEAAEMFGNDQVYLEKLIEHPRSIEIQVLSDSQGNFTALCERECSIQGNRQKLIEEAPSPALDAGLRRSMSMAALKAVRAVGYENAGSVEFLVDGEDKFYFMEMNTRMQVEHPVTEEITGIDIVKEQIRIAAGEPLTCSARAYEPFGHAIEFRINAQDPDDGFAPCVGTITRFDLPAGPGVRVETAMRVGDEVCRHYDTLIAKIIVHGRDRAEAIARARRALDEMQVEGVKTTLPFHRSVLRNGMFVSGNVATDFVDTQMGEKS